MSQEIKIVIKNICKIIKSGNTHFSFTEPHIFIKYIKYIKYIK